MSLILNEEQAMLRDSAADFLARRSPVSALRALRDRSDADGFSRALWGEFAALGFCGVIVPQSHGGTGLGHVEVGAIMEQVGRHLVASPFLSSCVVGVTMMRCGAGESQQSAWLPRIARGEALVTLALDERAKHDPCKVGLRATAHGAAWVLEGEKTFVLDGHVADALIVVARTAGQPEAADGLSLFLVDRTAPGMQIARASMIDAHNSARVTLRGVRVEADALIGPPNGAYPILAAALDAGRAAAAAELLGVAGEAFDRTVEYLKQRRQFGRLIGEFQALQHRAAQLYTDIELTRAVVMSAQRALDSGDPQSSQAASLAKAIAGRTATRAVQEAVQMHGGMGMTDEFEIGFFMKRARVLQELFGDTNFHLDWLARQRGY
jgi:alkylation response protein AidB-like acyl-CoA dehydrogenase